MKETAYLQGAFILTITNLLTGIIAFVYRIFLTRHISTEGIGLYQLILPLYYFFITLVSSGLVTTISKLIAENRVKANHSNINRIITVGLVSSGTWSIILSILIACNNSFFATYILKDERTAYPILVFSPAIVFIALSAVLKGYFYGIEKVSIPAIIDVIEKLIRLIILIPITKYFIKHGIVYVCVGAMLAMVCGEILSLALLFIFYKYKKNTILNNSRNPIAIFGILKSIIKPLLPLSISGAIESILEMADAVLIPTSLIKAGLSKQNALSTYGKLTGMILPLLYFPMIIIASLSTTLIPSLAYSLALKNEYEINKKSNDSMTIASVIGFASSIAFINYPTELCKVLFNCPEAGIFLFWLSFPCIFEYWLFTILGILNGIGLQNKVMECSITNISIMTISILFFMPIPEVNIYAYLFGFVFSSVFVVIKGVLIIYKKTKIRFNINRILVKPFICALLMFISIKSLNRYMILYGQTQYNMMVSYAGGLIIYFIMIFVLNVFRPKLLFKNFYTK